MNARAAAIAGILLVGVAGGVVLFVAPRWYAPRAEAPAAASAPPAAVAQAPAAARKITATLFYVSEDGMTLVSAQREVPFGATAPEQARAIVEAQIASASPLVSAVPAETNVRHVCVPERADPVGELSSAVTT